MGGYGVFCIGDKVLYPMHGAGIIERIEEKEVLGERQDYYVLSLPYDDMSVLIPVERRGDVGLRPVIAADQAQRVLSSFGHAEADESSNWNKRYRENMLRIKSGDIDEVSCVLFALMKRDMDKGLSTGERKMMLSAKQIFVSEISLSVDRPGDEIELMLQQALTV